MKLLIKNMVSSRCKMAVLEVFKKFNLQATIIDLGEVEVRGNISMELKSHLKNELIKKGFDLIEGRKEMLVEKIKNVIIELVHHGDGLTKFKFSVYLHQKMNYDYAYLANVFSEKQGITIEKFLISHKIERVKELILYGEYNITEIAWKMNYSSVAHLSNQFKKYTGLTPSCFKQQRSLKRNALDEIGMSHGCIPQVPLQHTQTHTIRSILN
jgi:AraC-like DNA-binding protein